MAGRRTRRHPRTMRLIENEENKLITFSKRRSGIYKKASELVTLCGSEVGVVIFSPAGKPYSFAHPSIDSMANRFLHPNPSQNDGADTLIESYRRLKINELNQQHDKLVNEVEADKGRGKLLKRLTEGRNGDGWWEVPIAELKLEELKQMKARMVELQHMLRSSMNQRNQGAASIQGETSNPRNNPPSHDNKKGQA